MYRSLPSRVLSRQSPPLQRRFQSSYQPPDSNAKPVNMHREFYKHRGRPVFKALLLAICTYQVIYWGWAKLESLEVKQEKEGEMKTLETEIRRLTRDPKIST